MNAYKLEVAKRIIQIAANILVLGAVVVGMYHASYAPDAALATFCTWFFSCLVGILTLTWLSLKVVKKIYPVEDHEDLSHCTVVHLPRKGARLVRWKVLTPAIHPHHDTNMT